jgi:hypothetical protein
VLGVINARYGTPVRVNVFSGIVASVVVVLAYQITSAVRRHNGPALAPLVGRGPGRLVAAS